jgi:hypothetical protein
MKFLVGKKKEKCSEGSWPTQNIRDDWASNSVSPLIITAVYNSCMPSSTSLGRDRLVCSGVENWPGLSHGSCYQIHISSTTRQALTPVKLPYSYLLIFIHESFSPVLFLTESNDKTQEMRLLRFVTVWPAHQQVVAICRPIGTSHPSLSAHFHRESIHQPKKLYAVHKLL